MFVSASAPRVPDEDRAEDLRALDVWLLMIHLTALLMEFD